MNGVTSSLTSVRVLAVPVNDGSYGALTFLTAKSAPCE
jgi:hypothetical protein